MTVATLRGLALTDFHVTCDFCRVRCEIHLMDRASLGERPTSTQELLATWHQIIKTPPRRAARIAVDDIGHGDGILLHISCPAHNEHRLVALYPATLEILIKRHGTAPFALEWSSLVDACPDEELDAWFCNVEAKLERFAKLAKAIQTTALHRPIVIGDA